MKLNRTIPPQSKIATQFELPATDHYRLSNGLDVYYSEKSKLPIIKMSLIIPAGSCFDGYGNEGLAYLTSLVWDEGTGQYNSLQLADEIDKLGSSIDVSTGVDHIFLSITTLSEHFERTLELMSQIVKSPLFGKPSFEREKKKHLTKILQSFDDPSYIAANAFQKNIFSGSCYDKPILGYSNSVETLTLQSVKDRYNHFFSTLGMKLIVVGDIQKDELVKLLDKNLAEVDFKINRSIIPFNVSNSKAKLFFIDKEGAAQSEIIAGHLSKDRSAPDYLAAKMANSILGGQFSSRINLNLREDKGYTYGAHSELSYNKLIGYFSVSTSVQSEFTRQSIEEIRKEVNHIREDIKEEEIEFSKSYLVKQFPSMFETYSQIVQRITTKVVHNLDGFYDNYIQNIWDLTKDEILSAANNYFQPDELSFFVVGNKNEFYSELEKISDLELIELDKLGNPVN